MAKKKTTTKKPASKEVGKKAAESIQTSIDIIESIPAVKEEKAFTPQSKAFAMKSFSEKPKPLTEVDIDNEVKEALKTLGAIQSKYQQLNRTPKARKLRDMVRNVRTSYKEWK